jgi:hypothetical protein
MKIKFTHSIIFLFAVLFMTGCQPSQDNIEALPMNKIIEDDNIRKVQFDLADKMVAYFAVCYSTHLNSGTDELIKADSLSKDHLFRTYLSRLKPGEIDSLKRKKVRLMNIMKMNYDAQKAQEAKLPKSN